VKSTMAVATPWPAAPASWRQPSHVDLGLAGAKALVTGGTRGIGRGVVLALARAGAQVITCYRQVSTAAATLERDLAGIGGQHHVLRTDLADFGQTVELVEECGNRFGQLDLVVANAGAHGRAPYQQLDLEQWHRVFDGNLTMTYRLLRQALPLLDTGSSVIAIGDRHAELGLPAQAHYAAAKAGLVGLIRSLSVELGPRGIRANLVCPGTIATEALDALPARSREEIVRRYADRTALGRLGDPDDVAGAVLWLASDLSRYVTGATIHVDGGIF
jgi:3-oxoacyl-[acyl-carrier protein] reductase